MTPEKMLFTAALGLQSPWFVSDVELDTAASRIDIIVENAMGKTPRLGFERVPSCPTMPPPMNHRTQGATRANERNRTDLNQSC